MLCGIDTSTIECLVVGDSEMTDGKLAEALGCPFFHVNGAHDLAMLHIILKAIHGELTSGASLLTSEVA